MLDPIADMLTRIRNAQRAGHDTVTVPFSKLKMAIAEILQKRNFVSSVKKGNDEKFPTIDISLKYEKLSNTKREPGIREIKRISKQGQRIYLKKDGIKKVKNGYGIAVISTSKGIMTGDEAFRLGVGGEVICELW